MPASHGGISPGRNGHSTGNHSGKRRVYPGTGNEDSGGGAQSGIRRKTSCLFCSLRIMGGRGLRVVRHTWGWRSCGCNAGRAGSGPGSWVTAHTMAPLRCLQCAPCPQLCRKQPAGNDGRALLRKTREKGASTVGDGSPKGGQWSPVEDDCPAECQFLEPER